MRGFQERATNKRKLELVAIARKRFKVADKLEHGAGLLSCMLTAACQKRRQSFAFALANACGCVSGMAGVLTCSTAADMEALQAIGTSKREEDKKSLVQSLTEVRQSLSGAELAELLRHRPRLGPARVRRDTWH